LRISLEEEKARQEANATKAAATSESSSMAVDAASEGDKTIDTTMGKGGVRLSILHDLLFY
jgi:hypothetical protein